MNDPRMSSLLSPMMNEHWSLSYILHYDKPKNSHLTKR